MSPRSHTTIQTLFAGAILVLAFLCYLTSVEINSKLELSMQGEQEIQSEVSPTVTITTERNTSETIGHWLDRHQEALDGAED